MNKANIEALNSLKVGDCLHSAGINGLNIHNMAKVNGKFTGIPFYYTHRQIFKVTYTSVDYVLINWLGSGTYVLYNID
jgi:hypothetical protein